MTAFHNALRASLSVLFIALVSLFPSGALAQGQGTGWNAVRFNDGTIRPQEFCFTMADTDATTSTLSDSSADVIVNSYVFNRMTVTSTTTAIAGYATGTLTSTSRDNIVINTLYNVYRSGAALGIVVRSNATATGSGTLSFTNTTSTSYTPTANDILLPNTVPAASIDSTKLHGAKRLAVMGYDASGSGLGGTVTITGLDQFHQGCSDVITLASTSYALTSHAYTYVTSIAYNLTAPAATDELRIGVWGFGLQANANSILSQFRVRSAAVLDLTSATGVWNSTYHTWYPTAGITALDQYCWLWFSDQTSDAQTETAVLALVGATGTGLNNTGFGYTN